MAVKVAAVKRRPARFIYDDLVCPNILDLPSEQRFEVELNTFERE
jgi:hypothetical protein